MSTTLWQNATVATFNHPEQTDYGILPQHDILVAEGAVVKAVGDGFLPVLN